MAKKLKYSYDDCYNAAKQCDSLKEFRARFNAIRQFSDKHGYTKTFDWLKKRASPGFWTKELAVEESKKYTTRAEFKEKNQYVYILSYKMGWLEEMDWLDTYILTKKSVFKRAEKYQTRTEFYKNDSNAYKFLCKYSKESLDKIFGPSKTKAFSIEECVDIAKKYNSRSELARSHSGVYAKLRKNNILDELFPIFNSNKEQELVMAESAV